MAQECADCLEKIRLRVVKVQKAFLDDGVRAGMFQLELLYCNVAARVVQNSRVSGQLLPIKAGSLCQEEG